MQAVKFDKQATFGVEIEPADHNEREIAQALNAAGIPTLCNGYNHTDSHSNWKVVPDGSCGAEIVSPILKGEEGLQQVREVCAVLNQIGCRVNRSTGVHVHHGFVNGTFAQMRSILFLYAKLQPYINAMLPSRIARCFLHEAVNAPHHQGRIRLHQPEALRFPFPHRRSHCCC